jgi:hypothetical protein
MRTLCGSIISLTLLCGSASLAPAQQNTSGSPNQGGTQNGSQGPPAPTAVTTPSVTVGTSTGVIESYALSTKAAQRIAAVIKPRIYTSLGATDTNKYTVVLFDQSQHDMLMGLASFKIQTALIDTTYQTAEKSYSLVPPIPLEFARPEGVAAEAALTTASGIMQSLVQLLYLFRTDVTFGGNAVNLSDEVLIDEVASALRPDVRTIRPTLFFPEVLNPDNVAASGILKTLQGLAQDKQTALINISKLQGEISSLNSALADTKAASDAAKASADTAAKEAKTASTELDAAKKSTQDAQEETAKAQTPAEKAKAAADTKKAAAATKKAESDAQMADSRAKKAADDSKKVSDKITKIKNALAPRNDALAALQAANALFDSYLQSLLNPMASGNPIAPQAPATPAPAGGTPPTTPSTLGTPSTGAPQGPAPAGGGPQGPTPPSSPAPAVGNQTPPPSSNTPALSSLVMAELLRNKIQSGNYALLVLHIEQSGGGYETKSSLWTFFGGAKMYNSGGMVATFSIVAPTTGEVLASGAIPIYTGLVKNSDVEGKVN